MSEDADLKELEKKAFKSTFEDGLWDLFFGLIILSISYMWAMTHLEVFDIVLIFIVITIWNIIAVLIFALLKKYVVAPRLGEVKFGPKRKVRRLILMIFLAIMVLINIIFLILTLTGNIGDLEISSSIFLLILGFGFFTVPIAIVAYLLQFFRMFIIGLLGGSCFFISDLLFPILGTPLHSLLTFGIVGVFFSCLGLVLLIKFLNKHRIPKGEIIIDRE